MKIERPTNARDQKENRKIYRLLPDWLNGRLTSYTAAASLGAFGFAQSSDAAIHVTDVPDTTITQGDGAIYVNLDGAGYNEFAIATILNSVRVNPYNVGPQSSKVLTSGSYYVFAFNSGDSIGPGSSEAGQASVRQTG